MAFRDGLNGLYNHRYFQDLMDNELSRSQRYKKPFSLMILDLDHFKMLTMSITFDPVGDIVLKEVSKALEKISAILILPHAMVEKNLPLFYRKLNLEERQYWRRDEKRRLNNWKLIRMMSYRCHRKCWRNMLSQPIK